MRENPRSSHDTNDGVMVGLVPTIHVAAGEGRRVMCGQCYM